LGDEAPIGRDELIDGLYASGIGCSVHYIPLHQQPYWRERYGLTPDRFPHSQHAYERMLSLPMHTRLSSGDVQRVIDAMRLLLA
jgi:dTDP-4-amino-4,6-dideoxygalactose transaminase